VLFLCQLSVTKVDGAPQLLNFKNSSQYITEKKGKTFCFDKYIIFLIFLFIFLNKIDLLCLSEKEGGICGEMM